MNSAEITGHREKLLAVLEHTADKCTDLILDAVRAKNQVGIQLAGETTVRIREMIDELRQPVVDGSEDS